MSFQALEALDRIKGEYRRYYDTAMDQTRSFDAGMRINPEPCTLNSEP